MICLAKAENSRVIVVFFHLPTQCLAFGSTFIIKLVHDSSPVDFDKIGMGHPAIGSAAQAKASPGTKPYPGHYLLIFTRYLTPCRHVATNQL
jgi:hypothetical protein